jgi:thiamine pyrophosphokinase
MSSHHIIREDQEPALLIAVTQGTSYATVQELLEWSPTVMVTEWVLHEVLTWGIKIDVVIARSASIPILTEALHDQFPVKILSCQDEHDALATALYFLIAAKQKAVNVLSSASLESFEPFSAIDLSVIQGNKRWSFIRSGSFEKWLPAERTLRVFPDQNSSVKTEQNGMIIIKRKKGFWISEE